MDHLRDLLELCGYSPEAAEAILAKTELADDVVFNEEEFAPERTKMDSARPARGQRSLPNPRSEDVQEQARQQRYDDETVARHKDEKVNALLIFP